jgi:hypothetical protein
MRKQFALIGLYFIFGFAQTAIANQQGQPEQWQRSNAIAAVNSVNIDTAVYTISNISTLADAETTLAGLRDIERRDDWPLPAREAAIYQFTRSLAELPREAIAPEILQYLQNYQAQTLVPHEDHTDAFVPLFNIRSAAAGIENGWQRSEYALEAETLLETNPKSLVSAYAESTNYNQRAAYLDVLQYARIEDVQAVQDEAISWLGETPELTPLLGATAGLTADIFAVKQLLINSQGAGLSSTLEQLGQQLPISETADLLVYAVQQAPVANAALAISAWWPRLDNESASRDLLVGLLDDPALGASAALALAKSPNIQTIKILQDTASGDTSAALRAQMALDFSRDRLVGKIQQ